MDPLGQHIYIYIYNIYRETQKPPEETCWRGAGIGVCMYVCDAFFYYVPFRRNERPNPVARVPSPRSTAPPVHAARTPHTSNRSRLAVVDPGQTDERVEDYSNQAVSDNVFLGVRGDWLFGCCSMLL